MITLFNLEMIIRSNQIEGVVCIGRVCHTSIGKELYDNLHVKVQ